MDKNYPSQGQPGKTVGGRRTRGMELHGGPENPLVSIITIVLNGESYIRPTIKSVLQQSYQPIEYIIIDGGSCDSTVSLIREYDAEIAYWQSEPDKGISDALNKGIELARGELIGLINAGDWYESDSVERVVNAFRQNQGVGIICGNLQYWKGREKEYLCRSVPNLLDHEMTITHPTCFVRAFLYRHFGLFAMDYKFAMDYELLLRFKQKGADFMALNVTLANMQHYGISEVNWKQALQETHRARRQLLARSYVTSSAYYYFLVAKRQLRIFLEKLNLQSPIHWYRSKLALVKKTKS